MQILRRVRPAVAETGRLLACESVIPAGNEYHHAKFLDLHMLVLSEDGRERTESEFRALYKAGGFELTRLVPTTSALSIIEGTPRYC